MCPGLARAIFIFIRINMSIEAVKERLPDYAKDIRLNLSTVLTTEGAPGLNNDQVWLTALAVAYSTRNTELIKEIADAASNSLDAPKVEAAKAAATIMAMNNVYYRFVHLAEDQEFQTMRANLRMMIIGKPGIDKIDFEIMSLAVSSINGCGMCIVSHKNALLKAGVTREGIQSTIRISAVLNAAAQALSIADL